MADEEILDYQQELSDLKEEYAKLQEHLTNVEIRYQTELTESNQQRHNDFAVRLQDVVVNLFGRSQFSDLKVLLENGSDLSVHKLVLLARSEDWGVPDLDEVDILDLRGIKYEVAYGMMKWVYTDEIDVEEEDDYLVELLKAATKYKLEALHIRCQSMMISIVNLDNANKFYIAATESSAELLKDHCMEFLSKHQFRKIGEVYFISDDVDEENEGGIIEPTLFSCNLCDNFSKLQPEAKDNHTRFTSVVKASNSSKAKVFLDRNLNKFKMRRLKNIVQKKGGKRNSKMKKQKVQKSMASTFSSAKNMVKRNLKKLKNNKTSERNKKPRQSGKLTKCYKLKVVTSSASFMCNICGKQLGRYDTLYRHKKLHLDVKPHVCNVCGKSFVRLFDHRRHTRTHLTPPTKKKYSGSIN